MTMSQTSSSMKLVGEGFAPAPIALARSDGKLTDQEALLLPAYVFGLRAGQTVHRTDLFTYTLAYYRSTFQEVLQGAIARSRYFHRAGNGRYRLTDEGQRCIDYDLVIFDEPGRARPGDIYEFTRIWRDQTITVRISYLRKYCSVRFNSRLVVGQKVMECLRGLGAEFRCGSSTSTIGVLNWIVQDNDYTWQQRRLHK